MLYEELQRYAGVLNAATLNKDDSLDDVVAALGAIENPPKLRVDKRNVGYGTTEYLFEVHPHGCYDLLQLRFRVSPEYFAVFKSRIIRHMKPALTISWNVNYERFKFPLEEQRPVVHQFISSVMKGF